MSNSGGKHFWLNLQCSVTIWRQTVSHIINIPCDSSFVGIGTEGQTFLFLKQ